MATYSGVFTLNALLTGQHRSHHGEILREVTRLVEARQLMPRIDARRFNLYSEELAYGALTDGTACGKIVVDLS